MPNTSISRKIALVFSLSVVLTAGCGGGSSGGSSSDSGTFGATFSVASASVSGVEGSAQPLPLTAKLSFTGTTALYLGVDYDPALVADVKGSVSGDTFNMTATLRGDASVGTHSSQIVLHACLDEACT